MRSHQVHAGTIVTSSELWQECAELRTLLLPMDPLVNFGRVERVLNGRTTTVIIRVAPQDARLVEKHWIVFSVSHRIIDS